MEITSLVEWDEQEDREILSQFLRTRTGQRLIPKIAESVPTLLGAGDTNAILIRNGEVRGFQVALRIILELSQLQSTPTEEHPSGAYAALDNDSAWGDGKKLTEPQLPT
jgi:hypothetical protein